MISIFLRIKKNKQKYTESAVCAKILHLTYHKRNLVLYQATKAILKTPSVQNVLTFKFIKTTGLLMSILRISYNIIKFGELVKWISSVRDQMSFNIG